MVPAQVLVNAATRMSKIAPLFLRHIQKIRLRGI
jgi:hypothetical protein